MADGIYTCTERVERDGVLVAFEGERMTMDEAERRGLLDEKPAKKPAAKRAAKAKKGDE